MDFPLEDGRDLHKTESLIDRQAQMPDALVAQINARVNEIMNDPAFRKHQLTRVAWNR